MSHNQNQQWWSQGDPNQQPPEQQLQRFASPGHPQSPQQPGFQHDQQSFSYSDGINQVHQQQSNTSWSTATPNHNMTSLPQLQMPQMQPMSIGMGGMSMNMPLALPPPPTPYQAGSPPPQQQYGYHAQQAAQQMPSAHGQPPQLPWPQLAPRQLTAPQSPPLPVSPRYASSYQQPAQQASPHQLGPPPTPAAQVTTPSASAHATQRPVVDYGNQLQLLQDRHDQSIRALEQRHEAREREVDRQGSRIDQRLHQVEAREARSQREAEAKDREIRSLREQAAASDAARLQDAEKHRREMADLVRSQSHAQQPAEPAPAFDMGAIERLIRETRTQSLSKSDIEVAIAQELEKRTNTFATKADLEAGGSRMQKALEQMPRGASEDQIQAAVGREITNTIQRIGAQQQQRRRAIEGGRAQQPMLPARSQQVETTFEVTEMPEDDHENNRQARPSSVQPNAPPARQPKQRGIAAGPLGSSTTSDIQIAQHRQTGDSSAARPDAQAAPMQGQRRALAAAPSRSQPATPQTPGQRERRAITGAPPGPQPAAPQTPGQRERLAIAGAPTSGTPFPNQQAFQPVQLQYDVPASAVVSPAAPVRQTLSLEGIGAASPPSARDPRPRKPTPAAQKQLEYSQAPSQHTSSGNEVQRYGTSPAPMQDQYDVGNALVRSGTGGERANRMEGQPGQSGVGQSARQIEGGRSQRQIAPPGPPPADGESSQALVRQGKDVARKDRRKR